MLFFIIFNKFKMRACLSFYIKGEKKIKSFHSGEDSKWWPKKRRIHSPLFFPPCHLSCQTIDFVSLSTLTIFTSHAHFFKIIIIHVYFFILFIYKSFFIFIFLYLSMVNTLYTLVTNLFTIINHFYVVVSNLYNIINKLFTKKCVFINSFKNKYEVK